MLREIQLCVFDHDSYFLEGGSWKREINIWSNIKRDAMERKDGEKKRNKDRKEEKKRLTCRFELWVKFCQDLLNIHSPLFYGNEQTVKFVFNLK